MMAIDHLPALPAIAILKFLAAPAACLRTMFTQTCNEVKPAPVAARGKKHI